jgi:o-succinylbenzoate synthase
VRGSGRIWDRPWANIALSALPGFIPGDACASSRHYPTDITEPFELDDDGCLTVPTGPGFGVEPDPARLKAITTGTRWLTP